MASLIVTLMPVRARLRRCYRPRGIRVITPLSTSSAARLFQDMKFYFSSGTKKEALIHWTLSKPNINIDGLVTYSSCSPQEPTYKPELLVDNFPGKRWF